MAERQWWASRDEEYCTEGPFRCRDDAIDAGREEWGYDGFYVMEVTPQVLRLDALKLLDNQYFDADDLFDIDHVDPDWVRSVPKEERDRAVLDLQALLNEWVEKNGHMLHQPNLFAETHSTEWFEPIIDEEEEERGRRDWE